MAFPLFQRRSTGSERPFGDATSTLGATAQPAPSAQPLVGATASEEAPLSDAENPAEEVVNTDLLERRNFVRSIPVADVKECDEEESWAIWSQWSNL